MPTTSNSHECLNDWWETQRHSYWLIQRLSHQSRRQPERGFDGVFSLDYMGSSEFEHGAAYDSLTRMRSAGNLEIWVSDVTLEEVTKSVYFVASTSGEEFESFERKLEDFQVWLDNGLRSKEWTEFREPFTGDYRLIPAKYLKTIAWWSFDVDIMWTLERTIAEELLYGLEHPAVMK